MSAAGYALAGALGGAAIGQMGAIVVGFVNRRHERKMYWVAARRAAFSELVAAAGRFQTRAHVVFRAAELFPPGAIAEDVLTDYIKAADQVPSAAQAAELFMIDGAMRRAARDLETAYMEVCAWVADKAGPQIQYAGGVERKTISADEAQALLSDARDTLLRSATADLGIPTERSG